MKEKLKKIDRQGIGIIVGLLAPVLGVFLFYSYSNFGLDFFEYLKVYVQKGLSAKILSLGLIANLIFFFPAINLNLDRLARGIIVATFIYGALILILKFFV
jgi:hypothetical protein